MNCILGTHLTRDADSRLAKVCELILTYVLYAFWADWFMFVLVSILTPSSPEQLSAVLTGNFLGYYVERVFSVCFWSYYCYGHVSNACLMIFSAFGCFFSVFQALQQIG